MAGGVMRSLRIRESSGIICVCILYSCLPPHGGDHRFSRLSQPTYRIIALECLDRWVHHDRVLCLQVRCILERDVYGAWLREIGPFY